MTVPLDPATAAVASGQNVQDIPGAGGAFSCGLPAGPLCFGAGTNGASVGTVVDVGGPASSVAAPAVTAVSPATGPASGGTTVTINGTGFTGATKVSFGSNAGTGMTVISATQITAVSPAHAAGKVNVKVTTPSGTSPAVTGDKYTYTSSGDHQPVTSAAPPTARLTCPRQALPQVTDRDNPLRSQATRYPSCSVPRSDRLGSSAGTRRSG